MDGYAEGVVLRGLIEWGREGEREEGRGKEGEGGGKGKGEGKGVHTKVLIGRSRNIPSGLANDGSIKDGRRLIWPDDEPERRYISTLFLYCSSIATMQ